MIFSSILKLFIVFSFLLAQPEPQSNQSYITGEDGVIRMYINVVGHVRAPGNYLVYDGVELMTAISVAGGYLPGAKLKSITIYSDNHSSKKINLMKYLSNRSSNKKSSLFKPNDTIYIEEKVASRIFNSFNNLKLPRSLS